MLERQLRLQHAAQWGTGDSPIGRPTTFDGFIAIISDLFNGFYRIKATDSREREEKEVLYEKFA